MSQVSSHFKMKKEHHARALEQLRQLWHRKTEMSGGSSDGRAWFAFCNQAQPESWFNVTQALREMRWRATSDQDGNITHLYFAGEKLGDDDVILAAIAPYVESGSWIEMEGEDGARWMWTFDEGELRERRLGYA